MKTLESSVSWLDPDSALVGLLQVVANVKEGATSESVSEVANLCVSGDHTSEPVIGHADGWDDRILAAVLETGFAEDSDLLNDVIWLSIWVRAWENVSVVKEDDSDAFDHTLVNSEGAASANVYVNVVFVMNTCWILSEVTCLSFSVSFVVWRDNNDLLAKVGKPYGELIDHYSEASDCGPSSKLRCAEDDWAHSVLSTNGFSGSDRGNFGVSSGVDDVLAHGYESG